MKRIIDVMLLFAAGLFAETIGAIEVTSTSKAMRQDALESLVRSCIASRAGDELTARSLSEDIKKLAQSGKIDDVRTEIKRGADGRAVLVFIITPKPIIDEIRIVGNRQMKLRRLKNQITSVVGQQVDEETIAADRKAMLKKYTDDGYFGTEIKTLRDLNEEGNVVITFAINEATHCKLHKVYFKNNTAYSQGELRGAIQTQRQWWRYIFRFGNFFNADTIPIDKDKLVKLYVEKGYMDFTVTEVIQQKIENDKWIDITFVLSEGQPYTVGTITMKGNKVFSTEDLLAVTTTKSGDVHDTVRENADIDAMRARYDTRGYIDLRLYPMYNRNPETHIVNIEYQIMEGEPSSIRNIDITGNTTTKDEVVRRELSIMPGQLGNNGKIKVSKQRIQNLGYFSSVEILPVNTDQPNMKDLRIELAERSTGQLSVGAGFSTEDNAIGFIEVSETNFDLKRALTGEWPPKGDGQKLRSRLQVGSKLSTFILSHTEPWFLDQRLELTTDFFLRNRNEDDYDERHLGMGQMLSWPFAFQIPFTNAIENWRIGIGYRVEQIKISHVTSHDLGTEIYSRGYIPSTILTDNKGKEFVPRLYFRLVRDTRDAFIFPTRGSRIVFQTELVTEALGGYETYGRISLEGAKYFPLSKRLTLKLSADYSTNTNTRAKIFDRYFAGGVGSVRGFRRRDVAPFDRYDDGVGGNSMLTGTVELITPVNDVLYFSVFCDAGNAWWDCYEARLDDICVSVGFGIQLKMLPVSVYYGYPIETNDDFIGRDSGRLHFNMGFNF